MKPVDVLAVVAHPDDESIWCGCTLAALAAHGRSVTVLCLTHASNPVRSTEFEAACTMLRVQPRMVDLPDRKSQPLLCAGYKVHDLLDLYTPRIVLTHGQAGESHGHRHHTECSSLVAAWVSGRSIPTLYFDAPPVVPDAGSSAASADDREERWIVLGTHAHCKHKAVAAHRSQWETIRTIDWARRCEEPLRGLAAAFQLLLTLAPSLRLVTRGATPYDFSGR